MKPLLYKTSVQFSSVAQSCLTLCDPTPWTVPLQAPLSIEFSRQEYQSGLPFPSPGDLPNSAIKLRFPALLADSLPTEPLGGLEVRIQGLHYHG